MPSFTEILNLSISASFLVLAVVLLRLVLKKAPKAFHCALWALVALRLLCPVSFESELSLLPSREVIPQEYLTMEPDRIHAPARLEIVTNPVYDSPVTIRTDTTVERVQSWDLMATLVWLTGMAAMGIYALYSYLSLRFRVRMAGWVRENVYDCDELSSPFILGILRPRIYLPSGLDADTKNHVLAHEKAHLKRLDHLWKPLGFALLTVHWFNPVMWLAYILLCRDIELACDERVIRKLDRGSIRAYSEALVRCSVSHRMIAVCPLAFGEVGVRSRIRSMLRYKKPGFWILLTAVIAGIALAVFFLTDPAEQPRTAEQIWEREGFVITSSEVTAQELTLEAGALPEDVLNGREHTFEPETILLCQFDSTSFYVHSARMSGDELLLSVRLSHRIAEAGSILLPFDPLDDSADHFVHMESSDVKDALSTYPDTAAIRSKGRDSFDLCVKTEEYRQMRGDIHFRVGGIYQVTYAREDTPICQILEREYRVEEIRFTHPTEGFPYKPEQLPTYAVRAALSGDLYLATVTENAAVQSYGNEGVLEELQLTKENFDDRFPSDGWTDTDDRADLRRNNLAAWRVYPKYTSYTAESILLLQKDGTLWLAFNAEPEGQFENLYRLTSEPSAPISAIITATTYYPSGMNDFTGPSFRLSSDGTFHLSENLLSSYYAHGFYTQTDTELVLKTGDDRCIWYFTPDGGGYRFDADRSSPITTCFDLKNPEPLPNGTLFLPSDSQKQAAVGLDLAIQSVIEQYCKTEGDEQYLITECHNILDAAVISGTPPAGSKDHEELVTIHAVGLVRRYTVRGTAHRFESEQLVHAVMTFLVDDATYTLQSLKTAADIPIADLYSPLALELWETNDALVGQLEDQCDWLAQLWVEENPPSENEIWHLIEVICSSPAWSSNPGDYIAVHQSEFQRLLQCDRTTVAYCFDQFSSRRQIGLQGHIMALACQAIIGETESLCIDSQYMTGQDWFDGFVQEAKVLRDQLGAEELAELHPYHFMALEAMGS